MQRRHLRVNDVAAAERPRNRLEAADLLIKFNWQATTLAEVAVDF
jgi:hypothetical protein